MLAQLKNETIRFYAYAYLQSFAGYNQMLKNEYGSVQQHLEAKHISTILLPIPPKWDEVKEIVDATRAAIIAREKFEQSFLSLMAETKTLLTTLIDGNKTGKKT